MIEDIRGAYGLSEIIYCAENPSENNDEYYYD